MPILLLLLFSTCCPVGAFLHLNGQHNTKYMHGIRPDAFVTSNQMASWLTFKYTQRPGIMNSLFVSPRDGSSDYSEDTDTDVSTSDTTGSSSKQSDAPRYKPPNQSSSFLQHLEQVRLAWPDKQDGDEEGVECSGEPAVDPSRIMQAAETDDSNWM